MYPTWKWTKNMNCNSQKKKFILPIRRLKSSASDLAIPLWVSRPKKTPGDKMNGPWGHYAKWNKSHRERQILHNLIYIWNKNKAKFIDIGNRSVLVRGGSGVVGKLMKEVKRVQISSYNLSKSWRCTVHHGDYS